MFAQSTPLPLFFKVSMIVFLWNFEIWSSALMKHWMKSLKKIDCLFLDNTANFINLQNNTGHINEINAIHLTKQHVTEYFDWIGIKYFKKRNRWNELFDEKKSKYGTNIQPEFCRKKKLNATRMWRSLGQAISIHRCHGFQISYANEWNEWQKLKRF